LHNFFSSYQRKVKFTTKSARGFVYSFSILKQISGNMAVLSPLTATSDDSSPDSIESTPGKGAKVTDSSAKVCKEQSEPSILSPSAVSHSSQDENILGGDDDDEIESTWKGDSWSQEDVRNF
jgi:hypothetical protein